MNALRSVLVFSISLLLATNAPSATDEIVSRIRRQPVTSSNVASIGYSHHLHALEIEFTRGAIYRFLDVPRQLYRELLESDSKGHFIAEHLRGRYRFLRVRPSRPPRILAARDF